jgi:hypothetical protein
MEMMNAERGQFCVRVQKIVLDNRLPGLKKADMIGASVYTLLHISGQSGVIRTDSISADKQSGHYIYNGRGNNQFFFDYRATTKSEDPILHLEVWKSMMMIFDSKVGVEDIPLTSLLKTPNVEYNRSYEIISMQPPVARQSQEGVEGSASNIASQEAKRVVMGQIEFSMCYVPRGGTLAHHQSIKKTHSLDASSLDVKDGNGKGPTKPINMGVKDISKAASDSNDPRLNASMMTANTKSPLDHQDSDEGKDDSPSATQPNNSLRRRKLAPNATVGTHQGSDKDSIISSRSTSPSNVPGNMKGNSNDKPIAGGGGESVFDWAWSASIAAVDGIFSSTATDTSKVSGGTVSQNGERPNLSGFGVPNTSNIESNELLNRQLQEKQALLRKEHLNKTDYVGTIKIDLISLYRTDVNDAASGDHYVNISMSDDSAFEERTQSIYNSATPTFNRSFEFRARHYSSDLIMSLHDANTHRKMGQAKMSVYKLMHRDSDLYKGMIPWLASAVKTEQEMDTSTSATTGNGINNNDDGDFIMDKNMMVEHIPLRDLSEQKICHGYFTCRITFEEDTTALYWNDIPRCVSDREKESLSVERVTLHIARFQAVIALVADFFEEIDRVLEWEHTLFTLTVFIVFIVVTLYMDAEYSLVVPTFLVIVAMSHSLYRRRIGDYKSYWLTKGSAEEEDKDKVRPTSTLRIAIQDFKSGQIGNKTIEESLKHDKLLYKIAYVPMKEKLDDITTPKKPNAGTAENANNKLESTSIHSQFNGDEKSNVDNKGNTEHLRPPSIDVTGSTGLVLDEVPVKNLLRGDKEYLIGYMGEGARATSKTLADNSKQFNRLMETLNIIRAESTTKDGFLQDTLDPWRNEDTGTTDLALVYPLLQPLSIPRKVLKSLQKAANKSTESDSDSDSDENDDEEEGEEVYYVVDDDDDDKNSRKESSTKLKTKYCTWEENESCIKVVVYNGSDASFSLTESALGVILTPLKDLFTNPAADVSKTRNGDVSTIEVSDWFDVMPTPEADKGIYSKLASGVEDFGENVVFTATTNLGQALQQIVQTPTRKTKADSETRADDHGARGTNLISQSMGSVSDSFESPSKAFFCAQVRLRLKLDLTQPQSRDRSMGSSDVNDVEIEATNASNSTIGGNGQGKWSDFKVNEKWCSLAVQDALSDRATSGGGTISALWNMPENFKYVQNLMAWMLDLVESTKNVFNWTSPSKTFPLYCILVVFWLLTLVIPNRYIILVIGIYQFMAKWLPSVSEDGVTLPFYVKMHNFLQSIPNDDDIENDIYYWERKDYYNKTSTSKRLNIKSARLNLTLPCYWDEAVEIKVSGVMSTHKGLLGDGKSHSVNITWQSVYMILQGRRLVWWANESDIDDCRQHEGQLLLYGHAGLTQASPVDMREIGPHKSSRTIAVFGCDVDGKHLKCTIICQTSASAQALASKIENFLLEEQQA